MCFTIWNFKLPNIFIQHIYYLLRFLVLEMQNELRNLIQSKNMNIDDISYGFHWPPFTSIDHLHMHAIAPASKMGFISRQVFKPINIWYCSVRTVN